MLGTGVCGSRPRNGQIKWNGIKWVLCGSNQYPLLTGLGICMKGLKWDGNKVKRDGGERSDTCILSANVKQNALDKGWASFWAQASCWSSNEAVFGQTSMFPAWFHKPVPPKKVTCCVFKRSIFMEINLVVFLLQSSRISVCVPCRVLAAYCQPFTGFAALLTELDPSITPVTEICSLRDWSNWQQQKVCRDWQTVAENSDQLDKK